MFFSLFPQNSPPVDGKRLRRIEHKLDLILAHLGIENPEPDPNSDLSAEVRSMADTGQVIAAIKRLREETGLGLKEAKDAVDEYLGRK
jgi:ribosomal protein L7/L12